MGTGHSGGNRCSNFHPPVGKTEGVWKKRGADPCNGKAHLTEEKPKERKVTIKGERISRYFTEEYSSEEIENIIYQLLEEWNAANGVSKQ